MNTAEQQRSRWILLVFSCLVLAFSGSWHMSDQMERNFRHVLFIQAGGYSPYGQFIRSTICHTVPPKGKQARLHQPEAKEHVKLCLPPESLRQGLRPKKELACIDLVSGRPLTVLALGSLALQRSGVYEATLIWQGTPGISDYLVELSRTVADSQCAVELLRIALLMDPMSETYYELGVRLREIGQLEQALDAFERVSIRFQNDARDPFLKARTHKEMGDLYFATGQADSARKSYERALALGFDASGVLVGLARSQLEAGDPSSAVQTLVEAIRKSPKNVKLHYWLARIYLDLGREEEAAEVLEGLIELDGNSAEAWWLLGTAENMLGNTDGALRAYRRYQILRPDDERAEKRIAELGNEKRREVRD